MQTLPRNRLASTPLSLERLEDRTVLSGGSLFPIPGRTVAASLSNGVLRIVGTSQDDTIFVKQTNGQIRVQGLSNLFPATAVTRIEAYGFGGKDWINFDSQGPGSQPIAKPSFIHGGDGDDLVFGSAAADSIFGEAGNDTLYGQGGNDLLDGGAGRDKMYGGFGNDLLNADFADYALAGQGNTDIISFQKLDPAPLAANNTAVLKAAVQTGLDSVSFSKTQNGTKFTVKSLKIDTVTIENGITTLALHATVRVQQYVLGQEVASSTGSVKFTLQPQLSAKLTELAVTNASIALANVKVTDFNLNNVPNWIDSSSKVRDFLEVEFAGVSLNYTSQLQTFLALGGSLGPTLAA